MASVQDDWHKDLLLVDAIFRRLRPKFLQAEHVVPDSTVMISSQSLCR